MSPSRTSTNVNGEILSFSVGDFRDKICIGNDCFICGRTRSETTFNDEHIVPDWVLSRFKVHQKRLRLPNGYKRQYSKYKIPCCQNCNSKMSSYFEMPISRLFAAGSPEALQNFILAGNGLLFYQWMSLIFLKIHLKDSHFRMFPDRRKGDFPISADYLWSEMHHLHAVARAFYVPSVIEAKAVGSLYVFPVRPEGVSDDFDLLTLTEGQTLYLRLGCTGVIAVFNDACASINRVQWIIDKIDGPLSWLQARELTAHFAMANIDLINRPVFWTRIEMNEKIAICGSTDDVPLFADFDRSRLGELMELALPSLPEINGYSKAEADQLRRSGNMSFLFNECGQFIRNHGIQN